MTHLRTCFAWSLAASVLAAAVSGDGSGESLPTPYTAEQIRDAWFEGFWIETETTQGEETTRTRTEVVAWSESGATMTDGLVGDGASGEVATFDVTWQELRDHALFPPGSATRERVTRDTSFGPQPGWLYVVVRDGGRSEFFFADAFPGAPVVYGEWRDGEQVMLARQVARAGETVPPE